MNKDTRTALEGSIDKWRGIVAGEITDGGSDNCPLCAVFKRRPRCGKCPVKVATGKPECQGSPYEKWGICNWATDKRSKKLARDELDFLISLRPS